MVAAPLKRYGVYVLAALGGLTSLGALLLLAKSVENSAQFGRWQPWILLLNLAGVLFLVVVLTRRIWALVQDFRNHVPGSRLTARTVSIFAAIVIAPLLIVYLFSLEFLNRGIDSWFRVEVKQGLGDALVLSRASLDLRMREQGRATETFARTLGPLRGADLVAALDAERRRTGASEMILFGRNGEVLAASTARSEDALHARPPPELLLQISENRPYVSLEPVANGGFEISTAAPIPAVGMSGGQARFVLALYGLPEQLTKLSEAVQQTYSQYGNLATLREPLKNSFRLTLTLVLLLAMLLAIYLAIFSAQRLIRPVQDLIEGTRAVGKGDFGTRLPLPSRDEMGFLVHSFNDMTKRLKRASDEARRSRQIVEQERERLAVILSGLSTGVLVVDSGLRLRIANAAADAILGSHLAVGLDANLVDLPTGDSRLAGFVEALVQRLRAGGSELRYEVNLPPDRVLRCACSPLAAEAGEAGYVIVFDDVTALLQAQRDAAWGEVARRLAHEIKNPLTPIQLSAERLRLKLGSKVEGSDAELLERMTQTIVHQVETLKAMVNAFSEYARAPEVKIARFDLNALVTEVAELYRGRDGGADIRVRLDPRCAQIEADRGRLRQVLNNLITNGIEAVGETPGGWVDVATEPARGGGVAITVSDNGHGFQPEMLARVFDPYVTSKPKGTGLGLAIVKKITEEHGGRIEAENRAGGGAQVRVVLPEAARNTSALPQRETA